MTHTQSTTSRRCTFDRDLLHIRLVREGEYGRTKKQEVNVVWLDEYGTCPFTGAPVKIGDFVIEMPIILTSHMHENASMHRLERRRDD